jgi:cytochrome c oxidase cbb3-type subunit I/II
MIKKNNFYIKKDIFTYDDKIVRSFLIATIFWGFLGLFIGFIISLFLVYPEIPNLILKNNLKISKGLIGYGRLRMIHTTTVIFAFIGNIIFAGSYYSLQRLLKSRMYSDILSWFHFFGWQLFIFLSWITFFLGINTSKEYSEHEWPLDLLLGLVWILYGLNMIGTISIRRVRHLYVSIWFYLSTWIAILILHIFNNLEVPISFFSLKSYSLYAGVQDALIQWWYGHNAVAFFLTTPILGLMYYFVPKSINKPVFSYKLSIIHFWSLIFIYIWAGPHHLIYTTLPNWVQVLGTIFSIMLIAPSWGGVINGLLTFKNSWHIFRVNPILKFFVVSIVCYGVVTFDGPMLATKTLNSIVHFTDWIVAHVHLGTLGWNGFMAFAVIYWLIEKLWYTSIYSTLLINFHFWISLLGMLMYVIPLYVGSVLQANMWKSFNIDGTLTYKNFIDSVVFIKPFHCIRLLGGLCYLIGFVIMIYNIVKTIQLGSVNNDKKYIFYYNERHNSHYLGVHSFLEKKPIQLIILSIIVISIGGAVEIIPMMVIKSNIPSIFVIKPYTPLELEGRDIYIREGCNVCHSQIIRPFRDEVVRYGDYSKSGEFVYDHPFLWGSKRTGPDLAREGGKNTNLWHFKHMYNPRFITKNSIMPSYSWLFYKKLFYFNVKNKMITLSRLGVPYHSAYINNAYDILEHQAIRIAEDIYKESPEIREFFQKQKKYLKNRFISLDKLEIIALIAYLQKLGVDIKNL